MRARGILKTRVRTAGSCVAVASVSVYRLEGGSVGAVVKVNIRGVHYFSKV